MAKIGFCACEHLDFSDNYAAEKRPIQLRKETKAFWLKPVTGSQPEKVQYCKKLGQLNNPEACTSGMEAMCGEYREIMHVAEVNDD